MKQIVLITILLFSFLSCSSSTDQYFYQSKEFQGSSLDKYFLNMEKRILRDLKADFIKKLGGSKNIYAGPQGFGFYNGEDLTLQDLGSKPYLKSEMRKNNYSVGLGFHKPKFPLTAKDVNNKVPIDPNDYYARLYLDLDNGKTRKELAVDYAVRFYCGKRRCRDTNITPFYDYEMVFENSDYVPKNIEKTILGIYYKWKPHITRLEFINRNEDVVFSRENFLKKYEGNRPKYFAIKNRLIMRGFTKGDVLAAIGSGKGIGFSQIITERDLVTSFSFKASKRRRDND